MGIEGLPRSTVSWPLTGGLATKDSPLSQVPGTHIDLVNVRQERSDEWRLRNGLAHDSLDDFPGSAGPARAAPLPGGGMVALAVENAAQSAALTYLPSVATNRWTRALVTNASQGTPSVWSRKPLVRAETPLSTSHAQGGNFSLTAHFRSAGTAGLYVHLAALTGETASPATASFVISTGTRPRCVYHPGSSQLLLFYIDTATNFVRVMAWNAATGALVTSATTVAAGPATVALDAIVYNGSGTVTVVFGTVGVIGYLEVAPSPLVVVTSVVIAVAATNFIGLLPDPDGSGVRFVALANAVPEIRVLRVNTAGAVLTNDVAVAGVTSLQIAGCAYQAGAGWMLVYDVPLTNISAVKKRSGVIGAASVVVNSVYYRLDTNAWRRSGTDLMRYVLGLHRQIADDAQATFFEMALPYEDGAATITNSYREPQARMLPLNAGLPIQTTAALPQVFETAVGSGRFVTALVRLAMLNRPASGQKDQYAIDAWAVDYNPPSPTNPVRVGEGTIAGASGFVPAGNLLIATTGETLTTHGASAVPFQPVLTQAAGGGLTLVNAYQFLVEIEYPDENGNVWRCYGIQASFTLTGGNQTINVAVALAPTENAARLVTVNIYATLGNGSLFRKVDSRTDRADALVSFTYVHTLTDTVAARGEPLSGEVPTTITPPLTHVVQFGGRLFGIDRDFPSRVWFTKPVTLPLQPEFPGGAFVITKDDEFGDFTQLAALDDRLILFKEGAKYVVLGDGPDNSGAGSFQVTRIDSDIGAIPGSPVVSTGKEVFYVTRRGIWRTDLGLNDDYVGAGVDQYVNQPSLASTIPQQTIVGGVFSSAKNEVRFLGSGDGGNGYMFVYDRLRGIWFIDKSTVLLGPSQTRMLSGRQTTLMSSGLMLFEGDETTTTDAGGAITGFVGSAWIRSAGNEGRIRLYFARVLGTQPATGPDISPALTIFRDNDETLVETFAPLVPVAGTSKIVRAEVGPRNQQCSAFRLRATIPAGAKLRLDKWAAVIGIKPTVQKLPSSQRWRTQ